MPLTGTPHPHPTSPILFSNGQFAFRTYGAQNLFLGLYFKSERETHNVTEGESGICICNARAPQEADNKMLLPITCYPHVFSSQLWLLQVSKTFHHHCIFHTLLHFCFKKLKLPLHHDLTHDYHLFLNKVASCRLDGQVRFSIGEMGFSQKRSAAPI